MKKGFTMIEALVTIVILAILAVIALPILSKSIRRAELKEVKTMVEATRAGAKDYDFRYTIEALPVDTASQEDLWNALKIERPSVAKCDYNIVNAGAGTKARQLQVVRKSDSVVIYTYDLPSGPGAIIAGTGDEDYLPQ